MARCRSLLQENESIGKMIASGRVAKIEGELALQRRLVDEMKSGQAGTTPLSLTPQENSLHYRGLMLLYAT